MCKHCGGHLMQKRYSPSRPDPFPAAPDWYGPYDGLGAIRKKEMQQSAASIGVSDANLSILDASGDSRL